LTTPPTPMKSSNVKIFIVVNFTLEGLHQWTSCDIEQVDYLRNLHRHVFYFNVKVPVTHLHRDIEIIKLKHELVSYFVTKYLDEKYSCCNFGTMSCEELATELLSITNGHEASVLEDNENGAYVCL
jgi:hypothetical protein